MQSTNIKVARIHRKEFWQISKLVMKENIEIAIIECEIDKAKSQKEAGRISYYAIRKW